MSGLYTMMSLGGFNFGLSTAAYQELRRSSEYLWPSQQRFGGGPAIQATGVGDETISLPGVIYPAWNGGTGQLDLLRSLALQKKQLKLIDGRGNILGEWVIERVEETQSTFAQGGVARKQEFTISLKKYGEIKPDALIAIAPLAAFTPAGFSALPDIKPGLSASSSLSSIVSTVTGTANAAFSTASRLSGAVGAALAKVGTISGALGIHSVAITKALNRSLSATNSIRTAAGGGLDLLRRVQTVSSASSAITGLYSKARVLTQPTAASSASIASSAAALKTSGASPETLGIVTDALVSANQVARLASAVTDSANTIAKKLGS